MGATAQEGANEEQRPQGKVMGMIWPESSSAPSDERVFISMIHAELDAGSPFREILNTRGRRNTTEGTETACFWPFPMAAGGGTGSTTIAPERPADGLQGSAAKLRFLLSSSISKHMVSNSVWLSGFRRFPKPRFVTLADGSVLVVVGAGALEVGEEFRIPDVYAVKGLEKNLISVGQLDKDHGLCCCFHTNKCEIMRKGGTVVGGAFLEDDGMYKLYFLLVPGPADEE
ncbi:hypothetical protein ACP70R_008107 [Stipagrostis hirtigluma subsp. patula]